MGGGGGGRGRANIGLGVGYIHALIFGKMFVCCVERLVGETVGGRVWLNLGMEDAI